ncbi:MAG: Mur ligase family protein [Pseudomonadota bacterium]
MSAFVAANCRLLDARRLTGRNAVCAEAAAVVDVALDDPGAVASLRQAWEQRVGPVFEALGWPLKTFARPVEGGVSLALLAPIDRLYTAVEIAEWALRSVLGTPDADAASVSLADAPAHFFAMAGEEGNPDLLSAGRDAAQAGVTFLWDDDFVSVGMGRGSRTWDVPDLPAPVDTAGCHDIPAAMITGTNGKTTTVRLLAHILEKAGHTVGLSSTDWIGVSNRVIDRGDWSGPGGARTILRETDVDVAVLETARGGLLRRGLGVPFADVAAITNISEDHLGDFGSANLAELTDIKWLVVDALQDRGTAVLNADDAILVERAPRHAGPRVWFSMHADNDVIRNDGSVAFVLEGDTLTRQTHGSAVALCEAAEIPVTLGATARHNIANALAAAAVAHALGVPDNVIAAGLQSMPVEANPGRSNLYQVGGAEVLLDFAHNPEAMAALFDMARLRPARRRVLCFGQAGDRTDAQIRELARGAWAIGLDKVVVSELATYHRGREASEVYHLIRDELLQCGAAPEQVSHNDTEAESLSEALEWAEPGDAVIMLALGEAAALRDVLAVAEQSTPT